MLEGYIRLVYADSTAGVLGNLYPCGFKLILLKLGSEANFTTPVHACLPASVNSTVIIHLLSKELDGRSAVHQFASKGSIMSLTLQELL